MSDAERYCEQFRNENGMLQFESQNQFEECITHVIEMSGGKPEMVWRENDNGDLCNFAMVVRWEDDGKDW